MIYTKTLEMLSSLLHAHSMSAAGVLLSRRSSSWRPAASRSSSWRASCGGCAPHAPVSRQTQLHMPAGQLTTCIYICICLPAAASDMLFDIVALLIWRLAHHSMQLQLTRNCATFADVICRPEG
jgi:hypothetical protein